MSTQLAILPPTMMTKISFTVLKALLKAATCRWTVEVYLKALMESMTGRLVKTALKTAASMVSMRRAGIFTNSKRDADRGLVPITVKYQVEIKMANVHQTMAGWNCWS